jgi:hypothetical protein
LASHRRTAIFFALSCALASAPAWAADGEDETDVELPVETHAFVSQGFIKTTKNKYLAESERGSLEFTEVGINFTKQVTDELRVGLQLFARDLGPTGNYTPQFDWFYLDYRFWDWLGVRAGRTKLPFGLYNETNDVDAARVPILLPQSVYPIENRDFLLAQTGTEVYGFLPFGTTGGLEYRVYGGTIFFDPPAASSQFSSFEVSVPYLFGGRLMWATPLDGLQLGGSLQKLRLDIDLVPAPTLLAPLEAAGQLPPGFDGTVHAEIGALLWVGSLEYAAHDLLLAAEYSRWHTDTETSLEVLFPSEQTVSERFYVMASHRVAPWFTPGLYYSVVYPNVDDRNGIDAFQHDVAVTFRYDLNDHWLLKLEGHYMHGTAALDEELNGVDDKTELRKDWGLFLAKTTAYF